ncbi:MAG: hypothetical protein JKY92_04370 [Magnetovibrio sp.]|nr:hypothetical protein [Magnetovibrio sp.]
MIAIRRNLQRRFQLFVLAISFVCFGFYGPAALAQSTSQLTAKQMKQTKLVNLTESILKLRLVGVGDPQLINKFFARSGTQPFDMSVLHRKDKKYERDLWRLFFKQSQAYLGAGLSTSPIVGYYNPIVDFWLLTQWTYTQDKPQLVGVKIYAGADLRDPKKAIVQQIPVWLRTLTKANKENPLSVREALQRQILVSVVSFLKTFPEPSSQQFSLPQSPQNKRFIASVFANRMSGFFKQNIRLVGHKKLFSIYSQTMNALAEQNWSALEKLNKPAKHRLTALKDMRKIPAPFLQGLQPMVIVQPTGSIIVLSVRIDNARFSTVTIFSEKEGKMVLDGLGYYDLYAEVHSQ